MVNNKDTRRRTICYPSIARLFSPSILDEFATDGRSQTASKIVSSSGLADSVDGSMRLDVFYDQIYLHLFNNYRNEYIYKNALVEKLLLGKHSLNTSFMLTEFRSGCCKADVVLLNGTSHVFEIKTQYDSLDRLENQLKTYAKQFDCIHVLTHESILDKVSIMVDDSVGLMLLGDRYSLRQVREPKGGKNQTQQDKIFDSLRKNEYVNIIKDTYGFAPNVPNTQAYKICKSLFGKLNSDLAHDSMVTELKKRGERNNVKDLVTLAPNSLKALMLSSRFKPSTVKCLIEKFKAPLANLISFY